LFQFILWWVIIQVFGLAALPLARRVFHWLPDEGYAFSKAVGLLVTSYLLWLGASAGVLVNDTGGILLALMLLAGESAWISWRQGREPFRASWGAFWQAHRGHMITVEALFLLSFAAWALVRAYAPDKILPVYGEKFMEIAFLNGVLNSALFPPLDPWLAGYAISYYYFGYVMMAVMTRLSGTLPAVGFDLYNALLFALTAITAYGLVFNMVAAAGGKPGQARASGLLGALLTGGMGNLGGLMEGLQSSRALPEGFWRWLDIPGLAESGQSGSFYPGHGWWWWRSSRVLRDLDLSYQPVIFQPIDEFPFFSFLLGDNHPHKLALPFVLLAAGLALNLLLRVTAGGFPAQAVPEGLSGARRWAAWTWIRRSQAGWLLFYAFVLGALAFLNTWDFPIYLGLTVLAYGAGRYWTGQRAASRLAVEMLALGAALGSAAVLLYLFFYLGFASQAGGILPYVLPPTRLPQYLVMFGPFVFVTAFLAAWAAARSSGGGFPWRSALLAWAGIAGAVYALFLLVLAAGGLLLSLGGVPLPGYLQELLGSGSLGGALANILLARLANPWLFLLLTALLGLLITAILRANLAPPVLFALLMALTGLALTLSVDFFYLRDNFGLRMNTVFKFYFQGWVMLAIASAFGVWWVSQESGRLLRALFLGGAALLIAAGMVYPLMAVYARTEGFSRQPTLDAAATFAGEYGHSSWAARPDDWAAIQWMLGNARRSPGRVPTILEAPGGGYQLFGRVSAFTGFPTLLGWTNHQGQWRGGTREINERQPDIVTIFTTPSPYQALELLHRWQVEYVIIGDLEREYIQRTCEQPERGCNPRRALEKFDQILLPMFNQGGTTIYAVP
jgi:YYY domain-containing protein